jgi:hypothetical protein
MSNTQLLDKLINPYRHSGNIHYKEITETEQREIVRYYRKHKAMRTQERFKIARPRLSHILKKHGIDLPMNTRTTKPKGLSEAARKKLEAMLGHVYEYMTFPRTILFYTDSETEVTIYTRLVNTGVERVVKLPVKGITRALDSDFIRVR